MALSALNWREIFHQCRVSGEAQRYQRLMRFTHELTTAVTMPQTLGFS
jgi:hypothetical protein